ncbi:hypothetical protein SCARR_00743 [Pontiella sulfatireligans]|uniref:Dystroglycan-type cadherin-like domain-containing protein n=2 Tax=Pontiella sulfatireligans TaxID=2750658 RepID=A0A6C2UET4_9BACT|nr:hypothetical protein SCARR_00743 [Pontiella sulfatireligans]
MTIFSFRNRYICFALLGVLIPGISASVPVPPTSAEIVLIEAKLDQDLTAQEAQALHDKIVEGYRIRDWTGDDVKGFLDDPGTMPIAAMTNDNWHFNGWFPRNIHRYYQHYRATGDPYCIEQLEYYAQWIDDYVPVWHEEQEKIFNYFAHPMVALLLLERMDAGIDPVDTATLDKCHDYLETFLSIADTHKGIDPSERPAKYLDPVSESEYVAIEQELQTAGLSDVFWAKPWNQRATTVTMMAMAIKATRHYHQLSDTQVFQADEDNLLDALNFWIESFYNHSSEYTYNGTNYVTWAYSRSRITSIDADGTLNYKMQEDTDHASHNMRALIYLWELGFGGDYFDADYIQGAANTAVDHAYLAHLNLNSYCPTKLTNSAPHLLSPQTAPYYENSWLTADGFGVRAIWWVSISGFRPEYYVLFTKEYRGGTYDDYDSSFAFCRYTRRKLVGDQLLFVSDNYRPVASNAIVFVSGGGSMAITLTGSDSDGDPLSYTVETLPTHGTLSGTAPNLTYTPGTNFFGSDSFTFTVNDGTINSLEGTVSIITNNPPVFGVDPTIGNAATQGVAYAGSIATTDVDGDSLTYSLTGIPSWLTVSANGMLGGTPGNDDVGSNSFTVEVDDGNGGTDTTILQIVVRATTTQTETDELEFDNSATNSWATSSTATRWLRPVGYPGSNRVWNVGETLIMEFDCYNISANAFAWNTSSMTLGFGIGDNAEAICWGLKHQTSTYQFGNISIDTSAGGAGSMSANLLSSSDRERLTGIEGTTYDLYGPLEAAHFILSAKYIGGTEYELSMTMSEIGNTNNSLTINRTRDEGVVIDAIDEFHIRFNLASGSTEFSFSNVVIKVETETTVVVEDTDGDGLTDEQETALGTDPYDPASMFSITGNTPLPGIGKIEIIWPSATGVLYRIWESPDLSSWSVARDWATGLTPPEDALEFDLSPSNGFFKVETDIL